MVTWERRTSSVRAQSCTRDRARLGEERSLHGDVDLDPREERSLHGDLDLDPREERSLHGDLGADHVLLQGPVLHQGGQGQSQVGGGALPPW